MAARDSQFPLNKDFRFLRPSQDKWWQQPLRTLLLSSDWWLGVWLICLHSHTQNKELLSQNKAQSQWRNPHCTAALKT